MFLLDQASLEGRDRPGGGVGVGGELGSVQPKLAMGSVAAITC